MADELTGQEQFQASIKRPDPNAISEDISARYRILFNSPLGRDVLCDMLSADELGLLSLITNEEERCRHNYAVNLLALIGVLEGNNLRIIVDSLMNSLGERTVKEKT